MPAEHGRYLEWNGLRAGSGIMQVDPGSVVAADQRIRCDFPQDGMLCRRRRIAWHILRGVARRSTVGWSLLLVTQTMEQSKSPSPNRLSCRQGMLPFQSSGVNIWNPLLIGQQSAILGYDENWLQAGRVRCVFVCG